MGVILYEFLYNFPPFNAESPYLIFENILNRTIKWENEYNTPSSEAIDLMNSLMCVDPKVNFFSFSFSILPFSFIIQNLEISTKIITNK